jgi:hypothetical protein
VPTQHHVDSRVAATDLLGDVAKVHCSRSKAVD